MDALDCMGAAVADLTDLIRHQMQRQGLSVAQAAKEVGISYPSFRKLATGSDGKRAPQRRVISALADWLGQDEGFLYQMARGKATMALPDHDDHSPVADQEVIEDATTAPVAAPAPAPAAGRPGSGPLDGVLAVPLTDLLAAAKGERSLRLERNGQIYVLSGERALLDFATGRI
jgi:transcriptional regulator with XRE-family HTH domain